MSKLLTFSLSFAVLAALNVLASIFFNISFIEISFAIGILGILITAPNNPLTDFFNSEPFIEPERERHAKLGKIPIYASVSYTLLSFIFYFFYYKIDLF